MSHSMAYGSANYDGWAVTCRCGWESAGLFVAVLPVQAAEAERAKAIAAHARHMALVHEAKTHSRANCGKLCIYQPGVARDD